MKNLFLKLAFLLLPALQFAQGAGDPPKVAQLKSGTDDVYNSSGLQVKPEYPGGVGEFFKFINENFVVPEVNNPMVAKILVSFVVEKDGSMNEIKILKDPGFGFGDEAKRVLSLNREKWKPGIQNDKPVRASYVLPITLNIADPQPPATNKEE